MGLISRIINAIASLLKLAIVADALLSWLPYSETIYNIRNVLQRVTYPITEPIRKLLSPLTQSIGIDITPIIAYVVVDFISGLIINLLRVLV